ncbi:DeoR/GlpR family transcriptional regulator of sugar metabolism [Saccharopolyspora lacisalsi]|uniref:DeoR/GlpR family transcriptional regulator of sugar metabolism n=1 Tax=Halosaccharopolyspora lacisalsi TaxID=1000566 RepID=A0A839E2T8_9PSEU|nr:DeoR/GlpR family DNA-binding transcription regulator [Halosaccharopolyspora lacisalsi]MBA8826886.1 DeoR/GlpR family transcriptional regulator of sugar metabolism [Halosaccharopolyspora lacisalsi]
MTTTPGRRPSGRQQDRRRRITELVMAEGNMRIDDLVSTVGTSAMTVYRDLADLESQGLVHRNRGYVSAASSLLYEAASEYRLQQNAAEKEQVARAAAALVEPGQALMLDDSTTGVYLARMLPESIPLTVVTNYRGVFGELVAQQGIHLISVGGDYLPWADAFVGGMALEALRGMRVDLAIMSVSAVTDGVCFYPQQEMVQLKKAMLASASRKVLYVDHTKFSRRALHAVAPAEDFDVVIVDDRTPSSEIELLRERGATVEQAGGDGR